MTFRRIALAALTCACAPVLAAEATPTNGQCESRVNDTPKRLLECITADTLWSRLADFQAIADANPDANGHGNRDTGQPGYQASVQYVVDRMTAAGYAVTVQSYPYSTRPVVGVPSLAIGDRTFTWKHDFHVAPLSAGGTIKARVQAAGTGCSAADYAGFVAGRIALVERADTCRPDAQVQRAHEAGAAALVIANTAAGRSDGHAYEARLRHEAPMPVLGVVSHVTGQALRAAAGEVSVDVRTGASSGTDYNVIAESPFGDPNHTVVVDAHLDSIFGAGILDNASGSATILEIALKLQKTPTANRLRFVWFGGEEIGLKGSDWYTKHLAADELARIAFDVDVDVTSTPNYDYLIANPANAPNVSRFPPNVVPDSQVGTALFQQVFGQARIPVRSASFGNEGTDSNSFSLVGIPNTGILTQQDCCKQQWEVDTWGGFLGNYEGTVPGRDGGCVDKPRRWCDNLANNDKGVMEIASRASAYVVQALANKSFSLRAGSRP